MIDHHVSPAVDASPPIATHELATRPCRHERDDARTRALRLFEQSAGSPPDTVLQLLADVALDVCESTSSGVSIEEEDGRGGRRFRWRAVSGRLAPYLGGTMPRDFSPCGEVLDRGALQLMTRPVDYYTYISDLPHIAEVLLVPLIDVEREILGTLWVVDHDGTCRFDAADAKALEQLASAAQSLLHRSAFT